MGGVKICKKQKGLHNRIDKCMIPLIYWLNHIRYETKASCCGHGKYPMTIIVKSYNGIYYELLSNTTISRKRKFYVKDKSNFYFIPEVIKPK